MCDYLNHGTYGHWLGKPTFKYRFGGTKVNPFTVTHGERSVLHFGQAREHFGYAQRVVGRSNPLRITGAAAYPRSPASPQGFDSADFSGHISPGLLA